MFKSPLSSSHCHNPKWDYAVVMKTFWELKIRTGKAWMNTERATDWLCVLDKLLYPSVLQVLVLFILLNCFNWFYWGIIDIQPYILVSGVQDNDSIFRYVVKWSSFRISLHPSSYIVTAYFSLMRTLKIYCLSNF